MNELPDEITPSEAIEGAILAVITKKNQYFENDRDRTEYLDEGIPKEKVHSLYLLVKIYDVDRYIINESLGVFLC